jgi:hypothetical protein
MRALRHRKKMIFGTGSTGTVAAKQKYLAYIVDHAEAVVDYLWVDIKVVAKALIKRQTLTARR